MNREYGRVERARMYLNDLWGSVAQTVADGSRLARFGYAAKVDHSPAVLPWQPHHVSGLEVAVHKPSVMHVRQALGDVCKHLHISSYFKQFWGEKTEFFVDTDTKRIWLKREAHRNSLEVVWLGTPAPFIK